MKSSTIILLTSLIILITNINIRAEKKILIVAESFPPFEFVKDGDAFGVDVDIVKAIFSKMNIEFEIEFYPWKRAWFMVEKGQADAVFSTSRKEFRKPYLHYPKEDMWESNYVFFKKIGNNKEVSIGYNEALKKKYRVGVIHGHSYDKSFWDAYPNQSDGSLNSNLYAASSVDLNFRLLSMDRIDVFIVDRIVGSYVVKSKNLQNKIFSSNKVLFSKGYPMPFVKKSSYPNIKRISEVFEEHLIEFKKSKEYQKIISKWVN
ncbi:MAG: amino acid ABC transporter substrate-binding protein [Desulfobacterales bacterium]|nr:amino acid ABC transporter substrate-binding protein [Desulfobacterales bacterium]